MRSALIPESRFGRYFFYALGEIVLVVIGILIALQINNWNEGRKERNQEKRFLVRLNDELNTDLGSISTAMDLNKERMQRAEFLMSTIDQSQLVEDSSNYFIQSIEYAGYTYFPVISDNNFDEIKSSGKLSHIRNEELRTALQKYYSWSSSRGQFNFVREDIQLNYLHERQGILSAHQQITLGSFITSEHFDVAAAKLAYEKMMKKPDFFELLPTVIQSQIRNGESFEDIKNRSIKLKAMIKNELNK